MRSPGCGPRACTWRRSRSDGRARRNAGRKSRRPSGAARGTCSRFHPLAAPRAPTGVCSCGPRAVSLDARFALRRRPGGAAIVCVSVLLLAEAGVVAAHVRAKSFRRLHNHFEGSSCAVAMLTSLLGGIHLQHDCARPDGLLPARELAPRREGTPCALRQLASATIAKVR